MPKNTAKTSRNTSRRTASTRSARTSKTTKNTSSNRNSSANKTNKRRESSIISLNNGISVLRTAINNSISVSAAAKANGHGRNYVSDIKARIEENYKSGNIPKSLYTTFQSLSNRYNKMSR